MSSMVTTATVSTVTTAITLESLGQILALVALLALAVGLIAREIILWSDTRRARIWARGLEIGTMPLLVTFLLIAVLQVAVYAQTR